MNNKIILLLIFVILTGCNVKKATHAGLQLLLAASVNTSQMKSMAATAAKSEDAKNSIAPGNNKYSIRLSRLTKNIKIPDKIKLNYKVYLNKKVNAFAMADGTVRVYSGLMDLMTDKELLFVIGHEVGHVHYEHSKQAYQLSYTASAARTAISAFGGEVGKVASGSIGGLAEKLLNSQFSQSEEIESDSYGIKFLKYNRLNPKAALTALKKMPSNADMLSTHPSSAKRISNIKSKM